MSITPMRRGLAVPLLVGVGLLLARRAELELRHYPPLAAWGCPPVLLPSAIFWLKASVAHHRPLLVAMMLVADVGPGHRTGPHVPLPGLPAVLSGCLEMPTA